MDDIEAKIRVWDAKMRAAPTFEEFRDVEFIRRSGSINMLTGDLQRELIDRGRYHGAAWLERCRKNRMTWHSYWDEAFRTFESSHGPVDTWYSRDLLDGWEEQELAVEESRIRLRLAEIRERRLSRREQAKAG